MLRRSVVAHAVLLFAAVALPLAAAQPWPVCGRSAGTYTAGSTYSTNLENLALTLRTNASSSPTLFASGALGSAPDTVYGLLLCRGDLSSSDCADCGTNVWRDAGPTCNRTKDAILVYNQCYAQFSDKGDFLASTNNSGAYSRLISVTNITSTDVAGYDRAVTELLNATVRYAVENSTKLFATGQRVDTDPGFRNIYSMAQCSPDLSPAQCRSCLDGLVGRWWDTFPLNGKGARVAGPRCYLRSELGPFYTGSPMVRLPVKVDGLTPASAPAPAPDVVPAITRDKNNSGSKILVIILPTVSVAIIIAVISLCIWNVRKKRRLAKAEHLSGIDTTEDFESVKSTLLSLASLQVATDNFHESKKIGEGGFGAVYKSPSIEQENGAMGWPSSVVQAVLILVVAAVALPLAAAQPWPICGTGGNYTAGSTYESNLLRLASTLRANASASPTLFASGVRGTGPDAVYGLLLCRGDMSSSDCFDCGTRVGDDVGQVCNRTKDAILVYNQCYAQFSDKGDFLAATNNSGTYSLLISGTNISSSDVAGYDRAVSELLNATVRYAVENSTRLFATGQRVGTDPGFRNIYSMAQCSPDLTSAVCRRCLDGLVTQWWKEFLFPRNGEGARVAGPRCYLRSELGTGPFYTGAPMVLLRADGLSPTSAPAPDVVPATTLVRKNSASKILVIVLPIVAVAIVAAISLCMWTVREKSRSAKAEHLSELDASEDLESVKSTLLTLGSLQVATDNFDESKKLGEGGFGAVYKGLLFGQEVAVKRMAKGSNQGLEELKNELVLVSKLHHRNLVRLVGFCLEDGERLLVYEYMPNKSLDTFLFDAEQRTQLDWATRFRIIEGVARGLQYLHQDSQKKIVHRDMKASNVLLDADLNPKIGDFGLARLFGQDQTRDVTNRIVGTFGYMAPEYVIRGQYSTKSDVFSFGILVLEIVTGQRNSGPYLPEQNEDLVSIVWRHWTEGNIVEMIDYSLDRNYPEVEVLNVSTSASCVSSRTQ